MTEIDAYQEYIRCKHNAFCKAVIRYAAIGKIIRLRQKWEREISLDYLTNEKFIQFAEPEPDKNILYHNSNCNLYHSSHDFYLCVRLLRRNPDQHSRLFCQHFQCNMDGYFNCLYHYLRHDFKYLECNLQLYFSAFGSV
jgi:hypothetical protein